MGMNRFDKGKRFVFQTILRNDRLNTYSEYIKMAKDNNYQVCSMIEFYQAPNQGKHFVLRHDVDYSGPATRRMFFTEQRLGIHSTYYFRKSTIDIPLMNEMIDAGFEVGFHYETLSDYATENNLDRISERDLSICRERLKKEIMDFNSLLKKPISSIVGHGTRKNFQIGQSNNVLLENQDYKDFGIVFEGYDKNLYADYVSAHIMDGSIRRNFGFSYSSNPIEAIDNCESNIVFLSHPNHWYKTLPQRGWELTALVLGRYTPETNREFSRILETEKKQQ